MNRGQVQPFLKWAGGKSRLAPEILSHFKISEPDSRYFEPFLGGGSVFFALAPIAATLSDANLELIDVYSLVRDDVDSVIELLRCYPYDKEFYYQLRSSRPATEAEHAARFIYLNKTCFNGLYRVNGNGDFNVPFGRHPQTIEICNEVQLRAASAALQGVSLVCDDFEAATSQAVAGDLVYFDPPYTVAHSNNGFVEYNRTVFSWEDQGRLAKVAASLVRRGVQVVISNADHPSIIECYLQTAEFQIHRISRWSTIAGNSSKRPRTTELILVGVR